MAMENLYLWMLKHQDLQPVLAPAAAQPASPGATVGNNVKISGQSSTPRSESDIQINPNNPQQIIAASNNPGGSQQAQYFSADGATSWGSRSSRSTRATHCTPTQRSIGPPTGRHGPRPSASARVRPCFRCATYKSTDAGKTWVFDATFSGSQTATDKQQMCVDSSRSLPFRDNIYLIWHDNAPAFVTRRTAAGWQVPNQVSGNETTGTAIGSDITTNARGDVFAVWPDTGSQTLFMVKSTDGGQTWTSSPIAVSKTFGSFQISVPSFAERSALVGASIAAYSGGGRNDVYVSWTDLSGATGCDAPGSEPGDNASLDLHVASLVHPLD